MSLPSPYIARRSGDLILAADWNEFQRRFRAELADHTHTGGEQGPVLDGDSFDPQSTLRVAELHVADKLIVGGRDVGAELANASGSDGKTLPNDLVVNGDLQLAGSLRLGAPTPLRASAPYLANLSLSPIRETYGELLTLTLPAVFPELYLVEVRAWLRGGESADRLIRPSLWLWVETAGEKTQKVHLDRWLRVSNYEENRRIAHRAVVPVAGRLAPTTLSLLGKFDQQVFAEFLELVATPMMGVDCG